MKYVVGERPEGCVFCLAPKAEDDEATLIAFRGEHNYIILNAYPYNNGHVLVVPYEHLSDLTELSEPQACEMFWLARMCVRAMQRCMKPEGVNIGMNVGRAAGAGIEDHLHLHIVPRWSGDTNFMSTIGDTRVVPQSLDECSRNLAPALASVIEAERASATGNEAASDPHSDSEA
jgi:ATP adenylyltransferase